MATAFYPLRCYEFKTEQALPTDPRAKFCHLTGLCLRLRDLNVCRYEEVNGELRSPLACQSGKEQSLSSREIVPHYVANIAVWWRLNDKFIVVSFAGHQQQGLCSFYMLFFIKDNSLIGLARLFETVLECIAIRWGTEDHRQRTFRTNSSELEKLEYTERMNYTCPSPPLPCKIRWTICSGDSFYKSKCFQEKAFYLFENPLVPVQCTPLEFKEETSCYAILYDRKIEQHLLVLSTGADHFCFRQIKADDFSVSSDSSRVILANLYECDVTEAVSYEGRFFFFSNMAFETNTSLPYTFSVCKNYSTVYISKALTDSCIPLEFAPVYAHTVPSAPIAPFFGVVVSSKNNAVKRIEHVLNDLRSNHKSYVNMSLDVWRALCAQHSSLHRVAFLDMDLKRSLYIGIETDFGTVNTSFVKETLSKAFLNSFKSDTNFDLLIPAIFSVFRSREVYMGDSNKIRLSHESRTITSWLFSCCPNDVYMAALSNYNIYLCNGGVVLPKVTLLELVTNERYLSFLDPVLYFQIKGRLVSHQTNSAVLTVDFDGYFQEFIIADESICYSRVLSRIPSVCWLLRSGQCINIGSGKWFSVQSQCAFITGVQLGDVSEPPLLHLVSSCYACLSANQDIDLLKYGYAHPVADLEYLDFSISPGTKLIICEKNEVLPTQEYVILYVVQEFLDDMFSMFGSLGSPLLLHTAVREFLERCGMKVPFHPSSFGMIDIDSDFSSDDDMASD